MRDFISSKMSTIGLSGIRKVNEKALAMEREGKTVIHFEIGRPDFDTPEYIKKAAAESGHTLYLPHGAILGLDGVFDGRTIIDEVSIETIKNPKSLGRDDKEYTVVFDGTAREATGLYPRNVNVHAALSLAGIGFDRTHSRIISDPSVNTNEHVIRVKGEGIDWTIHVTAFAAGAVSGKYVPFSACGSLDRILGSGNVNFV